VLRNVLRAPQCCLGPAKAQHFQLPASFDYRLDPELAHTARKSHRQRVQIRAELWNGAVVGGGGGGGGGGGHVARWRWRVSECGGECGCARARDETTRWWWKWAISSVLVFGRSAYRRVRSVMVKHPLRLRTRRFGETCERTKRHRMSDVMAHVNAERCTGLGTRRAIRRT
jgi:hypothetical protein